MFLCCILTLKVRNVRDQRSHQQQSTLEGLVKGNSWIINTGSVSLTHSNTHTHTVKEVLGLYVQ